jgi:hypothetical protein
VARTAISPLAYVEAWKTRHYDTIHEAALKEASRQVNEMVKWMDWQIRYDPDLMKEIHMEGGVFGLVRKARNYRESMIYQRNKLIAGIGVEKIKASVKADYERIAEINEQIAKWQDEQYGGCRRILKIYCAVTALAGGSLEVTEVEELDYEYDPEKS